MSRCKSIKYRKGLITLSLVLAFCDGRHKKLDIYIRLFLLYQTQFCVGSHHFK